MKRALLVKCEDPVRVILAKRLHKLGYSVTLAGDSDKALEMLRHGAGFHLTVIDGDIEGSISGWDLAEVCRQTYPVMGLIMTVGRRWMERDPGQVFDYGFPVLLRPNVPPAPEARPLRHRYN